MNIKVGCCGFPVSKEEYYRDFKTLEVQITFYTPPKIITLEKWRTEAPTNFEFVVKAWQLITHHCGSPTYHRLRMRIPENKRKNYGNFRPTDEVLEAWETTSACCKALAAKKVLFQSPPTFGPTAENKDNMKRFFKKISAKGLGLIWEPRGRWLDEEDEIEAVCRESNLIHCATDPFRYRTLSKNIGYFRLHGKVTSGHIDYNYQYSKDKLKALLGLCTRRENYCMFNNAAMYEDALRFQRLLRLL